MRELDILGATSPQKVRKTFNRGHERPTAANQKKAGQNRVPSTIVKQSNVEKLFDNYCARPARGCVVANCGMPHDPNVVLLFQTSPVDAQDEGGASRDAGLGGTERVAPAALAADPSPGDSPLLQYVGIYGGAGACTGKAGGLQEACCDGFLAGHYKAAW
jgi:hypothetical protein